MPDVALEGLELDRAATVPIRRQLAAALTAALRDGAAGREPLPSTRDLSRALGVHRHTVAAAYRQLRRDGLIRSEAGRRCRPCAPGSPDSTPSPEAALDAYVRAARAHGLSARQAAKGLEAAARSVRARRPLVVEPEAGLRRVLAEEVGLVTRIPADATCVRSLLRDPGLATGRLVLARSGLADRLSVALSTGARPFPLHCRGGTAERERIRTLPPGAIVAVFSISPAVRRYARELATTLRGAVVATPDPSDGHGVERAVRVAVLLLADAWCAGRAPLRGCPRVVPFRVLHPRSIGALRDWLELGAEETR